MKQFKVLMPFDIYKRGDIVAPTGLWRDHLQAYGFIAMQPEPVAPPPAPEPEPEPVVVVVDEEPEEADEAEDDDEVEAVEAVAPEPKRATGMRGRKRRANL